MLLLLGVVTFIFILSSSSSTYYRYSSTLPVVVFVVFATDKNDAVGATGSSSRAERLLALFKSSTKRSGARLRDIKNVNRCVSTGINMNDIYKERNTQIMYVFSHNFAQITFVHHIPTLLFFVSTITRSQGSRRYNR